MIEVPIEIKNKFVRDYLWEHNLIAIDKGDFEKLTQIKAEPVAWMYVNADGECEQIEYGEVLDDPSVTPLYTAPPQREWQGLTDEEWRWIIFKNHNPQTQSAKRIRKTIKELEQALKEKNR